MKILHTSDWHIGKRLHKMEMKEEHKLFFDWLHTTIVEHQIDLLLVAGDVFDTAYPSQESLEIYYDFLASITRTSCKIIVTGGNHDSPHTLNAPRELLKHLNIQVIGGSDSLESQIIPVYNDDREVELVVAAVPYLRDTDLKFEGQKDEVYNHVEHTRNAILDHYRRIAERIKEQFPNVPAIAMGHLFANGVTTSESERTIQVGNLAGVEANDLPPYFQYYAFGHIHKAQWIGGHDYIRYCGSPIALSFAEWEYTREVLILDTGRPFVYQGHTSFVPEALPIPTFRNMVRLKGSFEELEKQLDEVEHTNLPTFAEIEVQEKGEGSQLVSATYKFLSRYRNEKVYIVKHLIRVEDKQTVQQLQTLDHTINTILPEEVFLQKIEGYPEEEKEELLTLFRELVIQVEAESRETNTLMR